MTLQEMTSARFKRGMKSNLGINSFYRFHIAVGIFAPLVSGAIFYASDPSGVSYINGLFMTASALTTTGLNTIILSPLTTWQQTLLMLLWLFGNPVTVSWIMLAVRRVSFGRALRKLDQERSRKSVNKNKSGSDREAESPPSTPSEESQNTALEGNDIQRTSTLARVPTTNAYDRGSWPNPAAFLVRLGHSHLKQRLAGKPKDQQDAVFNINEVVGPQSQFQGASVEEHERLTRQEMGAMNILLVAIALYWLSAQLLASVIVAPYYAATTKYDQNFTTFSSTWFSIFTVSSLFNNVGLSLTDNSLANFYESYILLVPAVFLMLFGNMLFPVSLRFGLWLVKSLLPRKYIGLKRDFQFVLDHPRRVYYMLFPTYETWILGIVTMIVVSIDWVCFFVLNIGNPAVYDLPVGASVIDGLVQAIAIRSAGFTVVSNSALAPSEHILSLFMIYFAIFPLAMTIRATNIYEERSIGIENDSDAQSFKEESKRLSAQRSYVVTHMKDQLAYDMWYIMLCSWIITIVERVNLQNDEEQYFNIYSVLYESVSAYANAGLSLGLPYANTSFCGSFRIISKIVLLALMIRGRTRALPLDIDRATMLPSQLSDAGDKVEQKTETGLAAELRNEP